MWTILRTPALRAASASRTVPTTLTLESNCASSTERLTEICAARWKITSGWVSANNAEQIGVDDVGLGELVGVVPLRADDVGAAARAEVVDADDGVTVRQQAIYQR